MVEGAPLLREYTGDRIVGSNPILSATWQMYRHAKSFIARSRSFRRSPTASGRVFAVGSNRRSLVYARCGFRDTSRPTGSAGWFERSDRRDPCHRPRAAKLACKDPDLAKERSAVDGA